MQGRTEGRLEGRAEGRTERTTVSERGTPLFQPAGVLAAGGSGRRGPGDICGAVRQILRHPGDVIAARSSQELQLPPSLCTVI